MFLCALPGRPAAELRLFASHDAAAYLSLIETNRAWLRRGITDLDAVRTLADAETVITAMQAQGHAGTAVCAGVWERGALAGSVCLRAIDRRHDKAAIEYWLGAAFTGRGLMTQAVRSMLDHAFGRLGLNRVEIRCPAESLAARAIPRRLGFTEEGVLREARRLGDRFVTDVRYGMLAREWQSPTDYRA